MTFFKTKSYIAIVVLIYAFVLSLRPLPEIDATNDSGRYYQSLIEFCSSANDYDLPLYKIISFNVFNFINSFSCAYSGPQLFFFIVALYVPLGFLFSVNVSKNNFILFLSLLFNVFQLELATSAMRQALSIMIYLMAANRRLTKWKNLVYGLSAVVHISIVPFVLYDFFGNRSKNWLVTFIAATCLIVAGSFIVIAYDFLPGYDFFQSAYEEIPNLEFVALIFFPSILLLIFRFLDVHNKLDADEFKFVLFVSVLYLISLLVFPAISFRFVITGYILQLQAAMVRIKKYNSIYILYAAIIFIETCIVLIYSRLSPF